MLYSFSVGLYCGDCDAAQKRALGCDAPAENIPDINDGEFYSECPLKFLKTDIDRYYLKIYDLYSAQKRFPIGTYEDYKTKYPAIILPAFDYLDNIIDEIKSKKAKANNV